MPTSVPMTFWSTIWTFPEGGNVVTPLLLPKIAWVDESTSNLANRVASAIENDLLAKGHYSETLDLFFPEELEPELVSVEFLAPRGTQLFPDLQLEFEVWFGELARGDSLCFVPVLGLEAWGSTRAEAGANVREAIRLEFARKKRLKSVHALLSTQWCEKIEVRRTELELPYYSLHELKEIAAGRVRKLLPRAAFRRASAAGQRVFELENPVEGVARVLRGQYSRSVLLVGPSGSGKSALVSELIRTASERGLPSEVLWETTAARLVQKLTGEGGWQERLARVCTELRDGQGILFVRNLADLFEVGRYLGNNVSIAEFLRPYLERSEILLISECTPQQLALIEARAPGYLDHFHQVRLEEPSADRIERIAKARLQVRARETGVRVLPEAVRECLRLQKRFTPYSGFPGKTVRFLESLVEQAAASEDPAILDETVVLRAFCAEAGLPLEVFDPAIPFQLAEVEEHFRSNVFGQDAAIQIVVGLLAAVKAGLVRGRRPIASLLFIGPTGVGKTELGKVTAEFMFGDRARMVRFDMSEYSDPFAVLRLTDGQGAKSEGLLTGLVRQEPFSLVLFDEVEKAHPSFFDLLLQILGDGRLTDAQGRTADFCSTIIIMTSNLGAGDAFQGSIGFGQESAPAEDLSRHFEEAVQEHLRPELFNRIDRVVTFDPLDREATRRIVDREVALFKKRPGLEFRDAAIHFDEAALDRLGERGHHAAYGARQLQRQLREDLVIPLARQLNDLESHAPFQATVSEREGRIHTRVIPRDERRTRPRRSDGADTRSPTDEATDQRRLLQRIEESYGYARLVSRREILDRKLSKLGRKFWEDPRESAEYTEIGQVVDACQQAFALVGELELELLLERVHRAGPTDEARETLDWPRVRGARDEVWRVILWLYDTLNPGARDCVIGIYGDAEMVDWLREVYGGVVQLAGFESEVRPLYLIDEKAAEPEPEPEDELDDEPPAPRRNQRQYVSRRQGQEPPRGVDRTLGVEIGIAGPAAHLLFAGEGGLHEWPRQGKVKRVVVRIENCGAKELKSRRPTNIHRSAFFSNRRKRRVWRLGGFEDTVYREKVEELPLHEHLHQLLLTRLRKELLDQLAP